MPNQYKKVSLFIDNANNLSEKDKTILSQRLSISIVDSFKDILPKDIDTLNHIITETEAKL